MQHQLIDMLDQEASKRMGHLQHFLVLQLVRSSAWLWRGAEGRQWQIKQVS